MKIDDNGVIREATEEELAALEAMRQPAEREPTADERLAALEGAMLELLGVDV